MERVKGIEPSYSAWKAAALPLSYTRAWGDHLTRHAGGLNYQGTVEKLPGNRQMRLWPPIKQARFRPESAPLHPLTATDSLPILLFPQTTKGGDPVSLTKRCHLAGIAR
jgi:hypothetical protein